MRPLIPRIPLINRQMILLAKPAHLVLETPPRVMRLLPIDVAHQRTNIRRSHRKQTILALPREPRNTPLLHPHRRRRLQLLHHLGRNARRRQPQRKMHMILNADQAKTIAPQTTRRSRKIPMQIWRGLLADQTHAAFRAENHMHQIEAQRLRHGFLNVSGLQPSIPCVTRDLGLRPRLLCARAFGPHSPVLNTSTPKLNPSNLVYGRTCGPAETAQ